MLSQEFSRTKNRILGALSRIDDFFMNPLIQGHSGTAPETSRNTYSTTQGTNVDDSQSDPHPEASIFHNQTRENSGPEDGRYMVRGVHEEVTYCSPSTPSGKQKNNRSISPPQLHSEKTPATTEGDKFLWALQQLPSNNYSAKIHNNNNRNSKFPKMVLNNDAHV